MTKATAEILREYGPFPGVERVNGVTYDGASVWLATGERLQALDPESGKPTRSFEAPSHAGTAFDGRHLYQIAGAVILKLDPEDGSVLATIPAPGDGADSGLAYAEGRLFVGQYRDRKIHEIDPETGTLLRTIISNRVVTGVTWVDGELWHGVWEDEGGALLRVDPETGAVHDEVTMPDGKGVSGLESDGGDIFYCGGGSAGVVRAVRRPGR